MQADLKQRIRTHLGDDVLAAVQRGDAAAINAVEKTLGKADADELRAALPPPEAAPAKATAKKEEPDDDDDDSKPTVTRRHGGK